MACFLLSTGMRGWVKHLSLGLGVVEPSHQVASEWRWGMRHCAGNSLAGWEGCLATPPGDPAKNPKVVSRCQHSLGLPSPCLHKENAVAKHVVCPETVAQWLSSWAGLMPLRSQGSPPPACLCFAKTTQTTQTVTEAVQADTFPSTLEAASRLSSPG